MLGIIESLDIVEEVPEAGSPSSFAQGTQGGTVKFGDTVSRVLGHGRSKELVVGGLEALGECMEDANWAKGWELVKV
jgi:hypothetical protein